MRHPETLWAAGVPLVGGVFVVMPMLGVVEWLTPPSSSRSEVGWGAAIAGTFVALAGAMLGVIVLLALLQSFG
jgi:hypothetical protein